MKEIGGYFELQMEPCQGHYHKDALLLNSASKAFAYVLKCRGVEKVYMPAYICDSMIMPLDELEIDYAFYNVDDKLELLELPSLESREKLLYVNYFGVKESYAGRLMDRLGAGLIVDNSQSFYSLPQAGIDTVYSPRKFFGVSDGGLLCAQGIDVSCLDRSVSNPYIRHLVGRMEEGAACHYEHYSASEDRLDLEPIALMSRFTDSVLQSIDYAKCREIRLSNFQYLHRALGKYNEFVIDVDGMAVPMVYPFLSAGKGVRASLLENNIYTATYWKDAIRRPEASPLEKHFSSHMLPLPIDHRYGHEEMEKMVALIQRHL